MLNKEENELICRIGPGTPMGSLIREYWIPFLQTDDIEADGEPQRVRLLGEDLVAFRDTSGQVGLVAANCPHRGASLFFGRNEECGLRCVYHGWKFDAAGNCVDMPNEPADSDFRTKVKAIAYPCQERNGVVWTYMGPRATPPPLPEPGWSLVPATQRQSLRYARACNWLQALEGDIDSSHVNYLHRRFAGDSLSTAPRLFNNTDEDRRHFQYFRDNGAPTLQVVDTDVGVTYGARRPADAEHDFWRITQFLLPFYTSIPGTNAMGSAKVWVPLDDEHTLIWEPSWSLTGTDLPEQDRAGRSGRVPATGFAAPRSSDPLSRWNFVADKSNDYFIDRQKQKTENYTGLDESNPLQDGAVQESMGAIFDRSTEHLGSADAMIIRVRRRLIEAVRAHNEQGVLPPGVDMPSLYRRRGVQLTLPQNANWIEATEDLVHQVVPV